MLKLSHSALFGKTTTEFVANAAAKAGMPDSPDWEVTVCVAERHGYVTRWCVLYQYKGYDVLRSGNLAFPKAHTRANARRIIRAYKKAAALV